MYVLLTLLLCLQIILRRFKFTVLISNIEGTCAEPGGIKFASRSSYSGPYNVGDQVTYNFYDGRGGTIICQSNSTWTQKPICTGDQSHSVYFHAVRTQAGISVLELIKTNSAPFYPLSQSDHCIAKAEKRNSKTMDMCVIFVETQAPTVQIMTQSERPAPEDTTLLQVSADEMGTAQSAGTDAPGNVSSLCSNSKRF